MKMIKYIIYIALFLACSFATGERFAYWDYEVSEESEFNLVKENNGFYLEFTGDMLIEIDIAVLGGDTHALFLVPSEDQIKYFPRDANDWKSAPEIIQLINSRELAQSIIKNMEIKNKNDYTVIGKAKVSLKDFNIGHDCGIASYFSFKYSFVNYELAKSHKSVPNVQC